VAEGGLMYVEVKLLAHWVQKEGMESLREIQSYCANSNNFVGESQCSSFYFFAILGVFERL